MTKTVPTPWPQARRLAALTLFCSLLAAAAPLRAGSGDYYECIGADGVAAYSTTPCAKGDRQRRVAAEAPPPTVDLGVRGAPEIRLESGRGGHFYAPVAINGVPMRAVIDTGATAVSIGAGAARRLGLDPARGVTIKTNTANGVGTATAVTLATVEVGGNVVRNVPGLTLAQDLGGGVDVLLGMSFLKNFEVSSDGSIMRLRAR